MPLKTEEVDEYNIWHDQSEPKKQYSHEEFMTHLKDRYGLNPKSLKGERTMLMHMDGDNWFSYTYEWEIEGIEGTKFTQNFRKKRRGLDAMMWQYD